MMGNFRLRQRLLEENSCNKLLCQGSDHGGGAGEHDDQDDHDGDQFTFDY